MSTVTSSVDSNGVARIVIDNPEKHNAFDDQIIAQLSDTFGEIGENPNVRATVLSSVGRSFSAGADLGYMKRMAEYSYEDNLKDAQGLAEMLRRLNSMPMPTIARVQGAAFGGAVGLVSCCDMAIASSRASFCLSEVKIGLIPATISPYVIAAMGQRAARRYFTTAERFSAQTAQQLGLVSEVSDEEDLDSTITHLLDSLLANGPQAVREAKALIQDYAGKPVTPQLIADSSERIALLRVSNEGQEGLSAFLAKRPAIWNNH